MKRFLTTHYLLTVGQISISSQMSRVSMCHLRNKSVNFSHFFYHQIFFTVNVREKIDVFEQVLWYLAVSFKAQLEYFQSNILVLFE
jgi:hypothetical protein